MNFSLIINRILILFLIIFVGYILRKKGHINQEVDRGLSNLLIDVTLPALIISSMALEINQKLISNIKLIALISVAGYLFVIIFTTIFLKFTSFSPKRKTIFEFLLIFGNVGYMGYPVLNAIYPEYGIFYGVFNNITFNVLIWTFGVYLFTRDQSEQGIRWQNLINNGIIAVLIGFFLLFTGYRFPAPLTGALDSLGEMTFPLSMLVIGSSLARINFKNLLNKQLFLLAGLKLLIIPLLILFILKQFQLPQIIVTISFILFAMPSGANGVIFAERYEGDYIFAAEGVVLTTALCLFTIPLMLWIIRIV